MIRKQDNDQFPNNSARTGVRGSPDSCHPLSHGCTPRHCAGSQTGEPGGPHPHALPAALGSPCPTTWQQPLRRQKLSGCDRCRFFFLLQSSLLGGAAQGLVHPSRSGKRLGVISPHPKPSLPTQSSHLIPDLPVWRNEATAMAEPLGFTAGVFAEVCFWVFLRIFGFF